MLSTTSCPSTLIFTVGSESSVTFTIHVCAMLADPPTSVTCRVALNSPTWV